MPPWHIDYFEVKTNKSQNLSGSTFYPPTTLTPKNISDKGPGPGRALDITIKNMVTCCRRHFSELTDQSPVSHCLCMS